MSEPGAGELEDGAQEAPAQVRPALDTRPLAAWWVIFAGLVVGLLFVLTDHMLRATVSLGAALLLAALLRVTLPGTKVGGIAVRGPFVDVVMLVLLGVAVLVSGFTLDLAAR